MPCYIQFRVTTLVYHTGFGGRDASPLARSRSRSRSEGSEGFRGEAERDLRSSFAGVEVPDVAASPASSSRWISASSAFAASAASVAVICLGGDGERPGRFCSWANFASIAAICCAALYCQLSYQDRRAHLCGFFDVFRSDRAVGFGASMRRTFGPRKSSAGAAEAYVTISFLPRSRRSCSFTRALRASCRQLDREKGSSRLCWKTRQRRILSACPSAARSCGT